MSKNVEKTEKNVKKTGKKLKIKRINVEKQSKISKIVRKPTEISKNREKF